MKRLLTQTGFTSLAVMAIVLLTLSSVGAVGYLAYRQNSPPKSTTTIDEKQPDSMSSHPNHQSSSTDFNAEVFYNQVQTGMNYNEVVKLAGKEGDCAQTAVYPPSGQISCTWSDSALFVTVHVKDNQVISKAKRGL